jgi:hypothetical protein
MSSDNTNANANADLKVKKPALSGKFSKFMVFGHWFIDRLALAGTIDETATSAARDSINLFAAPEEQNQLFELFFEQLKDSTKSMKALIKLHNKPPKAKKEKVVKEKADKKPRAKKGCDVVLDKQDELVAEIVAAAQADIPTGAKKRIIKRKTNAVETAPTEVALIAEVATVEVAPVEAAPIAEPKKKKSDGNDSDAETKKAEKAAEKAAKDAEKAVEKAAEKLAKDAEKAVEKAAKDAEKAVEKAAKDNEKAAEKAAKDNEKAAEKAAKKAAKPTKSPKTDAKTDAKTNLPNNQNDDNDDELHLQIFTFNGQTYLIDKLFNLYLHDSINNNDNDISSIGTFDHNNQTIHLF